MDKNTVWAIVLSTLVIIATYFMMPKLFPSMARNNQNQVATENTEENVNVEELSLETENEELSVSDKVENLESEEEIPEETITVVTDLAEIVLTNRGGDIISYKLLNHLDTETHDGVQLSDNISSINRTAAISFGKIEENNKIVNDIFEVEKTGDYTYLFKKNIVVDGRKITLGKRYEFMPGEYVFKLDVLIHTSDGKGFGKNDVAYTIRTAPQIGPYFNAKQNRYENRQYVTYNGSKYKRTILGTGQFKKNDKESIWTGIASKYFIAMIIPVDSEIIGNTYYSTKVEKDDYANAQAFAERKSFDSGDISDSYYMYFGPRDGKELKRYNIAEKNGWSISGYKLTEALQSSGWLSWLETILKWCLELLHKVIKNWGVCIIVLTLLLKIVLFPLSKNQSMSALKMQELQPKMKAIQDKYKNDQQKLQIETSKLYKEAGYNPASGCLPMLFQFLILFAMYNLFNNYFEFRGAMFIPNWIPDLSIGDSVYTFKNNIPVISRFLGNNIRLLPVIYVCTQLLSGKITQYGQAGANQNSASMKFMMYGMPLIFFFLFYNAPSGLLLYWLTSNILQIVQQVIINKMMKEKQEEMKAGKTQKTLPPKAKKRK